MLEDDIDPRKCTRKWEFMYTPNWTCCNCANMNGTIVIRCNNCLDRPFRILETNPSTAVYPGSPPRGNDEVKSISISNLENLLETMVRGNLGQWYADWRSAGHNVPDLTEFKLKDLEYVFDQFKGSERRISVLKPEDVTSNLIRAYLLAGNSHPAKLEETKNFFSKREPDAALSYEWSLGLSKRQGVLHKLNSPSLLRNLEMTDPLIWIDVFFVDQLSKNITMDLAKAQGLYIKTRHHIALASLTLLDRGWCLFELCLRCYAGKTTWIVGDFASKEEGYDFHANMKLYDPGDRKAIEYALNRAFNYDKAEVNKAISIQILGGRNGPGLSAGGAVVAPEPGWCGPELAGLLVAASVPPNLNVVQVRIRSGKLVDLVAFVMADGQTKRWGSSSGGEEDTPFDLDRDEHIVSIVTQQGDSLDGLMFHTSKGRKSPWYGWKGGSPQVFTASAGNIIVGIRRSAGGFCPRIDGVDEYRLR